MTVAIIGGGPIGLAAAAHLASKKIPFKVFESGDHIGSNILSWGHVQLFSPWRYNMDKAAQKLLLAQNWQQPELDELHNGFDFLLHYLRPLADLPLIEPNVFVNSKVVSISRKGLDKVKTQNRNTTAFELRIERNGIIDFEYAEVVLDATGTWNQPNPIGSGGMPAIGETILWNKVARGIPDIKGREKSTYADKEVMVVGSGHSAINTLLDLADIQNVHSGTKLHWVLRKDDVTKVYGGQEDDGFEARGSLGIKLQTLVDSAKLHIHNPFFIQELDYTDNKFTITGQKNGQTEIIGGIEHIISNTGSRPNLEILKEVRIDLDASLESVFDLAALIDPNVHSCGTVRPHGEKELRHPEHNFYIIGSKSYGRAPSFLLATGYEQVRSIVAYLSGDFEAALRTELELPETGVCSSDSDDGAVCCAPEPKSENAMCC